MRIFSSILLVLIGLSTLTAQQTNVNETPKAHRIVILEAQQTSNYTYYQVKADTSKFWIAVPKSDFKVGDTCYYLAGMEMVNFKSKELNKTFPSVFFMDKITRTPDELIVKAPSSDHAKIARVGKKDIKFEQVPGQTSIAELFQDADAFRAKTIMIRGEVVKYNESIMGYNWAHIQDGSDFEGVYDLVVTTKESLKVGDVVKLRGKISLNKDFGSGYKFFVIMEDAVLEK